VRRIDAIITARRAAIVRSIHENKGWPEFRWDEGPVLRALVETRHRQGTHDRHACILGIAFP
jgi:shikimate kinase